MKTLIYALAYGVLLIMAISCQKDTQVNIDNGKGNTEFAFQTSEDVLVTLKADAKLKGASFEIYTANPKDGGQLFGKGVLDASGSFSGTYDLPVYQETVYIKSTYIGLPGDIEVEVVSGSATFDFNQSTLKTSKKNGTSINGTTTTQGNVVYRFLGNFDSSGKPNYLETPDQIDQSLLADINASLPESAPVPSNNPAYLASGNSTDIQLDSLCDAWVTFVHEGAGYKNVLGFYTYSTNNPPASVSEIDTITIMFPNASYAGSGGGLHSGDKVYLGRYPAGTSIGWVMLQDAWSSNSGVNFNKTRLFSEPDFNPEANASLRQHNVTLYHQQRNLVLIGFEDITRDYNGCDNDFNDAIYYITTNPVEAVPTTNYPPITTGGNNDGDNDGVDDNSDDYPLDPNKSFDQYYPNSTEFASLAFEDLWPAMGDYDFNDLVLDANYRFVTNSSNFITEMELKFKVRHIGASFHNGFGFQLPFASSYVSQVTGSNLTDGIVTLDGKGLETGQSKATVIVFDDAFNNRTDTITINISLSSPFSFSQFNQQGLNPFIFVDGVRGREVHLMDKEPTDLVDSSYFNRSSDFTDINTGKYYRSEEGYPWAIEINNSYMVPEEKVHIGEAYLKFTDWVQSDGVQYKDWYSRPDGTYRDYSKLQ